jgi:DNA-binding transcriptional LysR family regulator
MNLRSVDLNLLVAFDALLKTRHVTRAAQLLGIGQPGMSAALSRLRQTFGDDLLVKQGGEMVPTARALELAQDVQRILRDVELLLSDQQAFDAARSKRTFSLRMSDLLSFLLLPTLARHLNDEAPGIKLKITHLGPDATVDALERNEIELAVSTNLNAPKSIETETLFEDHTVCVCRRDHPALAGLHVLDTFLSLPQIRVAQSPIDDRFADRQLAATGRQRAIAMTVPHWLTVPEIVAGSDLVAVLPASIAQKFARDGRIALSPPPFEDTSFAWALYWHRRHASDLGHTWLREQIARSAAQIRPAAQGSEPREKRKP